MKRRMFLAGLAATAFSPLADARACSLSIDNGPLKIGRVGPFESFDPLDARGDDRVISRNIHISAFDYDWNGSRWTIEPALIENVDIADAKEGEPQPITLHVRRGVLLSDGSEISARLVADSLIRQIKFGLYPISQYVSGVEAIQVGDDYTLTITLKTKVDDFRTILLGPMPGCLIDLTVTTAGAQSPAEAKIPLDAYMAKKVKTGGAYLLQSGDRNIGAVLICKGSYPALPDGFQEIRFQIFSDIDAALLALENGDIHILGPLDDPRISTTIRRFELNDSRYRVERLRIASNYIVAVNRRKDGQEPSNSKKLALYHAARTLRVSGGLESFLQMSDSLFPQPISRGEGLMLPTASVEQARQLAKNLAGGEQSSTLAINASRPTDKAIAAQLAGHFAELGMDLEIVEDPKQFDVAYESRSAGSDLTLMRIVAENLTWLTHLDVLSGRDKSALYERISAFTAAGLPADGGKELESHIIASGDYIPLFDRKTVWATKAGITVDLNFDGQLGNLSRIRYKSA